MGHKLTEHDTQLYIDMYIAAEMLHCTHAEFLKLPSIERKKLRMYLSVKGEKRKHDRDMLDEKYNRNTNK